MKNILYLLFFCIFLVINSERVFSQQADSAKNLKGQLVPFPVIGNAPETGFQYGVGLIYTFFLTPDPVSTRASFGYSFNMWTVKKQTQIILQGSVWTALNKWNFSWQGSYTDFPVFFYGLGNDTKETDKDLIVSTRFKFVGIAKRKVINNFYVGTGLSFQNDTYRAEDTSGIFNTGNYVGKEGGNSVLLGYGGAYDDRDYENSTTKGSFLQLLGWTSLGVSGYKFTIVKLDARHLFNIDKTKVGGFQLVFQTAQGSNTPFYYLPFIGGDQILRGYYSGRYRERNMLATQGEFRYRPWGKQKDHGWFSLSRFSFAGFLGTGLVFENGDFSFKDFKPNYGGGFRYMFEPTARMTLRFDYGVGSKNPGEERSKGFYIALNEAF
ncbi:BamA/TamA family outer membrane protein [Solitalea koreensis]|uniref:Surface antigen n=1 Tax=Solitalea koreensis TaxID=543615 RepID=A0A521ASQ2_9SPHI|nr:hypothetical protein [Solitalea koreensis]SMO37878.1 hypothetical protein SAMN06265350_101376 [Solitalea koreensis]